MHIAKPKEVSTPRSSLNQIDNAETGPVCGGLRIVNDGRVTIFARYVHGQVDYLRRTLQSIEQKAARLKKHNEKPRIGNFLIIGDVPHNDRIARVLQDRLCNGKRSPLFVR
jgi:hypothetical protein